MPFNMLKITMKTTKIPSEWERKKKTQTEKKWETENKWTKGGWALGFILQFYRRLHQRNI